MNDYPVVALGSGQGSTIEFFCKKSQSDKQALKIKALVTDSPHSGLLKIAEKFQIPCHIVEYKNKAFQDWDRELNQILLSYKPQMIVLAGFLKKIGPLVLSQFPGRVINSHPSLLPEFSGPGMYGLKVHQAVIHEKKNYTGITIHIVNKNYDEGPILAQKKIPVQKGLSPLDLEKKVKKLEKSFYFETVIKLRNTLPSMEHR